LEDLSNIECISSDINKKIKSLVEEYKNRASAMKREREAQEKARRGALSGELLDSKIDMPMFPAFVKEEIKKKIHG